MKTLWEIMSWVSQKERFQTIGEYVDFAKYYLEFISTELQAEIVAQNETNYRFFQYRRDGEYNTTRPVNGNLFLSLAEYERYARTFEDTLKNIRDIRENDGPSDENTVGNYVLGIAAIYWLCAGCTSVL